MAVPGSVVGVGKLITPGGQQGPAGSVGPTSPSLDAGNLITTGSDSLLYLPPSRLNSLFAFVTKTAAYTLTVADSDKYFICSGGSWTLTLPAPSAGLNYRLRNDMGITGTTGTITLTPTGGTIDGQASIPLLPQQECTLITDGTNWRTHGLKREVIVGTQDIASATPSGTVLLPGGYRYYELQWEALVPDTGSPVMSMNLSSDGGSTWISGANYSRGAFVNNSSTTVVFSQSTGETVAYISGDLTGASTNTAFVKMVLWPGNGTRNPRWDINFSSYYATGNYLEVRTIHGYYNVAVIVNAIRYQMTAGNILGSQLTVKGVV